MGLNAKGFKKSLSLKMSPKRYFILIALFRCCSNHVVVTLFCHSYLSLYRSPKQAQLQKKKKTGHKATLTVKQSPTVRHQPTTSLLYMYDTLCKFVLYSTVHCSSYCTVQYNTFLYCTVLYTTVLYVHSTVHIVLYSTYIYPILSVALALNSFYSKSQDYPDAFGIVVLVVHD